MTNRLEDKMNKFIYSVQEWAMNDCEGKKPDMKLTFEEVLDAPWFFLNYQHVRGWVRFLEDGGRLSYQACCFRDHYHDNAGTYDGWEDSYARSSEVGMEAI